MTAPTANRKPAWEWPDDQLSIIPCPACGHTQYQVQFTRNDRLEIVACAQCGFTFVQPQPSQEALNQFYEKGYFSGCHDFYETENYFKARAHSIATEQITGWRFLRENVKLNGKRLLDLGCADGALLVVALKHGAESAIGVELNIEAVEMGRAQYNLEIVQASAEELPFESASFEVVTAFDVLEHVRRPAQMFREIHRVLAPGGILLGACPDMECFKDWGGDWYGVKKNMEHLSYFSGPSLAQFAQSAGLKLTLLESEGFPLELSRYARPGQHSSFLQRLFLQSGTVVRNVWQKTRVKLKNSQHKHELMFVMQKI
jgi:SAM-dependent methyltransferase